MSEQFKYTCMYMCICMNIFSIFLLIQIFHMIDIQWIDQNAYYVSRKNNKNMYEYITDSKLEMETYLSIQKLLTTLLVNCVLCYGIGA